jgi:hypothetical protein
MAGILGFGMFSSYFAMFHMDLENVLVFIYLKIISFGLIPITICFGWLYLWRNESNPFMFLSIYNSVTQALARARAFSSFITEMGIMGTLLAASSQLYWHDILKKRREEEIIERIFSELDAEESTPSL